MVNKIMVAGQPMVLGGPRKSLKTSVLVDLAISLGLERPFLGSFFVPRQRRVLFMSAESGEWTIRETALRVARAKSWRLTDSRVRWAFALPHLSRADHLQALADHIREHAIEVVILDPLYLALLAGNPDLNAGNMFDIGPLLLNVSKICLDAGCTPLLCHHTTKATSRTYEPPELEDLAWAGIAEFARQWLLIGRRQAYEQGSGEHRLWLNVGGSAGFGGLWAIDINEGCIDDEFEGRKWEVAVSTAGEARQDLHEQAAVKHAQAKAAKSEGQDRADKQRLLAVLAAYPHGISLSKLRAAVRMGANRCDYVLDLLIHDGCVKRVDVTVSCGTRKTRTVEGFSRIDPTDTVDPTVGSPVG